MLFLPRYRAVLFLLLALVAAGALAETAHAQIVRLPHPDTTRGNYFGGAVALDGDRALVGAYGEDACGPNSGAAYLFEREPATGSWRRTARLTAADCRPGAYFGKSVALSGGRAVVAASGEYFAFERPNAVYVFEQQDTTWTQRARLTVKPTVEEGAFASSVALQGDRLLVTTWGDPAHGRYGGAAYVFERQADASWRQVARLTPSTLPRGAVFGGSGDLDGDRVAVAASTYFAGRPGAVVVFERDAASGLWREAARLDGIDAFYVPLDLDGDRLLVGESKESPRQTGAATLFTRQPNGTWKLMATLRPPTPYDHGGFGTAVALQGDRAFIVGYDEQLRLDFNVDRVVYVFEPDAATQRWQQRFVVDIGAVNFGTALSVSAGNVLIGQSADGVAGAAYVVRVPGASTNRP